MENYIGKLVSFKVKGEKQPQLGIVLAIGSKWTLLRYNSGDYMLDGYLLLNHKYITGYRYEADEKFYEKIVKLKGYDLSLPNLPQSIDDPASMLQYLSEHYNVFQLSIKGIPDAIYLGDVNKIKDGVLKMNVLTTRAKWHGTEKFTLGKIISIAFDNDYINSLLLIAKEK